MSRLAPRPRFGNNFDQGYFPPGTPPVSAVKQIADGNIAFDGSVFVSDSTRELAAYYGVPLGGDPNEASLDGSTMPQGSNSAETSSLISGLSSFVRRLGPTSPDQFQAVNPSGADVTPSVVASGTAAITGASPLASGIGNPVQPSLPTWWAWLVAAAVVWWGINAG